MPSWYSEFYKRKNNSIFEKDSTIIKGKNISRPQEIPIGPSFDKKEIFNNISINGPRTFGTKKIYLEYTKKSLNKFVIFIGTLFLVSLLLIMIYYLTIPELTPKFKPLDAIVSNSTGLYTGIYYKNSPIFGFSGWESSLSLGGKSDKLFSEDKTLVLQSSRLFGKDDYKKLVFDDLGNAYTVLVSDSEIILEPLKKDPNDVTKIGWYTSPDQITVNEIIKKTYKKIIVGLNNQDSIIKSSNLVYSFYKDKPYFKMHYQVLDKDASNLNEFQYGFIIKGYDIYQSNGVILKNDNEVVFLEKPLEIIVKSKDDEKNITSLKNSLYDDPNIKNRKSVLRKGSTYNYRSYYQIFVDKNMTYAIIEFSNEQANFKNMFLWNVFQIGTSYYGDGEFSPVYFIIVEKPDLYFDMGDWILTSKQYSGSINSYILEVMDEIEIIEEQIGE